MRIISWNIRQGGGSRSSHISSQLACWRPDVVGLSEFSDSESSRSIANSLNDMGLCHQHSTVSESGGVKYGLLLASRSPINVRPTSGVLASTGRWIEAQIKGPQDMGIVVMWVPNRDEACTKRVFHEAVLNELNPLAEAACIALGDTNTGVPGVDDHTGYFEPFEGEWFDKLSNSGWADVWRQRNPEERAFTWYNSNGGGGFRLDQAFVTPKLTDAVRDIQYNWGEPAVGSFRGPSDHAAIIVDLD